MRLRTEVAFSGRTRLPLGGRLPPSRLFGKTVCGGRRRGREQAASPSYRQAARPECRTQGAQTAALASGHQLPGDSCPGPADSPLGPSAGGERCLFPRLFQMRETRPLRREEEKCIHQTVMIAVKLQLLKEPHGQTVPLHPEQQPGAARTPASRARLTARQEPAARSLPGPPPPPSLAGLSPAPLPSPAHPPFASPQPALFQGCPQETLLDPLQRVAQEASALV